jgi:hypothetical protein
LTTSAEEECRKAENRKPQPQDMAMHHLSVPIRQPWEHY